MSNVRCVLWLPLNRDGKPPGFTGQRVASLHKLHLLHTLTRITSLQPLKKASDQGSSYSYSRAMFVPPPHPTCLEPQRQTISQSSHRLIMISLANLSVKCWGICKWQHPDTSLSAEADSSSLTCLLLFHISSIPSHYKCMWKVHPIQVSQLEC